MVHYSTGCSDSDSSSLKDFQVHHPTRACAPFASDEAVSAIFSASSDTTESGGLNLGFFGERRVERRHDHGGGDGERDAHDGFLSIG